MPDKDRNAELYLNFQDQQQWLEAAFAGMTYKEYLGFVDYVFEELDLAAETNNGAEFRRVKGLILALARKHLEAAHFMDELTDEMRVSLHKVAISYCEFARGLYPAEAAPGVAAAWAASEEYAEKYGWPSAVFRILAPHNVFRYPVDRV